MKLRQSYIIIGILVLIGVLSLFFSGQFATITGYNILSIDEPNLAASDNLKDLNWLVTARLGGSESVQFTLPPDEFEQQSGEATENPFSIEVRGLEETLKYEIRSIEDDRAYSYTSRLVTAIDAYDNPRDYCPGSWKIYKWDGLWPQEDRIICINRGLEARYGNVLEPTTKFEAEMAVSNGETTIGPETISSDQSSVNFNYLGETLVKAQWEGSLVTGVRDPTVPQKGVLRADQSEEWFFITQDNFNTYEREEDDFVDFLQEKEGFEGTLTDFENFANSIENRVDSLESTRQSYLYDEEPLDDAFNLQSGTSQQDAYLEYQTQTQLTNPLVTFDVRADWLGLERRVGQPDIQSVESDAFGKGEQGTVNIEVRNDGSDARFFTTLEDCNQFTLSLTSNEFSIASGETRSYSLAVDTGGVDQDISERCDVCVKDSQDPGQQDCSSVLLESIATKVCSPGSYSIDKQQDLIEQCNEDGTAVETVEDCGAQGLIAAYTGDGQYDGYECIPPEQGTVPSDGQFNWTIFSIAALFGLIAGGYATMIAGRLRTGSWKWLVGLVVFVGVTLLAGFVISGIVSYVQGIFSL